MAPFYFIRFENRETSLVKSLSDIKALVTCEECKSQV